jgi:hypothetical protein
VPLVPLCLIGCGFAALGIPNPVILSEIPSSGESISILDLDFDLDFDPDPQASSLKPTA